MIFTGYRKDLADFFGLGGFFLRTSVNECGNVTNLLAQYVGAVVVGFNVSAVTGTGMDLVEHGKTGSLVPLAHTGEMAEEVIRLWQTREEYEKIRSLARLYVQNERDVRKSFVGPFLNLYEGTF